MQCFAFVFLLCLSMASASLNTQPLNLRSITAGASSINSGDEAFPLVNRGGTDILDISGGAATKKKGGFCPYHFVLSLKTPFFFALWYALTVYYNIVNKKLMNILPLPITLGTVQLLIGAM